MKLTGPRTVSFDPRWGGPTSVVFEKLDDWDLRTLWTKPFRLDVTEVLKANGNILEVDVVNLWTNRLIGDAGLLPEKCFTQSDVADRFKKGDPLLESGMLGPVMIRQACNNAE
jgi:hypothetical protein